MFVRHKADNLSLSSCVSAKFQTVVVYQQNRIAGSYFSDMQKGQEPILCAFVILMTTKDQNAINTALHLPLQFTAS